MVIDNQYFPLSGWVDRSYSFQELWNEASGQKNSRRDMKGTILLRTIVINEEVILKLSKDYDVAKMLRIFPAAPLDPTSLELPSLDIMMAAAAMPSLAANCMARVFDHVVQITQYTFSTPSSFHLAEIVNLVL